jgi:2-polyprenyl-3-methyl-5-hydroxy-6-metoxy-1,4-benzoquinol methylase
MNAKKDIPKKRRKPHSAETFIASRDLWWNADFLRLFRKRWGLAKVRTVLDVGCGVGHWGRTLAPILNAGTRVIGIDPEKAWVRKAAAKADQSRCRFEYRVGSATETGFPSDHFDMVTCQTVLIHVPDVKACLREMLRVLKPGGVLALAEPDNFSPTAAWTTLRDETGLDEIMEELRIGYLLERGKEILGEGDNSVGGKLPGWLAEAGGRNVSAYLSDRIIPLYPPYRSAEQKIMLRDILKLS